MELGCWDKDRLRTRWWAGPLHGSVPLLPLPGSWGPRPAPETGVHLLWPCRRRSAHWCPRRSAPSATAREGTGLTCARGRRSGPCTLARGGDEGPCIPRGCRSEGERTGPKRKAEPLCQGQLLLPDYPEKPQGWGEGEKTVSQHHQYIPPGPKLPRPALGREPETDASQLIFT